MPSLNIVLVEPQIPQNTGNIARTCAVTGARLHLVRPMGFQIDDKKLKRAGLDYWDKLDISYYDNTDDFFEKNMLKAAYDRTAAGIISSSPPRAGRYIPMRNIPTTAFLFSDVRTLGFPKSFCMPTPMNV